MLQTDGEITLLNVLYKKMDLCGHLTTDPSACYPPSKYFQKMDRNKCFSYFLCNLSPCSKTIVNSVFKVRQTQIKISKPRFFFINCDLMYEYILWTAFICRQRQNVLKGTLSSKLTFCQPVQPCPSVQSLEAWSRARLPPLREDSRDGK